MYSFILTGAIACRILHLIELFYILVYLSVGLSVVLYLNMENSNKGIQYFPVGISFLYLQEVMTGTFLCIWKFLPKNVVLGGKNL